MTKKKNSLILLGGALIFFGVIILLRSFFTGNEDLWICDNGSWVKHGNPSEPMPQFPAEKMVRQAIKFLKMRFIKKSVLKTVRKLPKILPI
jgi:hypothetical protein